MPDTNQNLDINIRTNADLSGARDTETQLKRDVSVADELANAFRECEARLEIVLDTLRNTNLAPAVVLSNTPPVLVNPASASPAVPATNNSSGFTNNPLPTTAPNAANEASSPENVSAPNASNNSSNPFPQNQSVISPEIPPAAEPEHRMHSLADGSYNDEIRLYPITPPPTNSSSGAPNSNESLQSVAEQFRTGWEQNSEFTVSLFEQMLILVSQQNQVFHGLQQRVDDLSGQLNSLKNP